MFLVIYWLTPVIYSLVSRPMLFLGVVVVVVVLQFAFNIVHKS